MQGGLLFYEKLEVSVAKLNKANLKKTLYYLQRNGLRETWISVRERLTETDRYFFVPCPFCGTYQRLEWTQMQAEDGNVFYVCALLRTYWRAL